MTNLPEDLNRWPSDPFKLLGVVRSADAKTVRRAYFKLVRKFKPDQYPTEFQKIREAFEQVEQWLAWNSPVRNEIENLEGQQSPGADEIANDSESPPDCGDDSPGDSGDEGSEDLDRNRSGDQPVDLHLHIDSPDKGLESADTLGFLNWEQFQNSLKAGDNAAAVAAINQAETSSSPSQAARANLTKYYLSRFVPDALHETDERFESTSDFVSELDLKRVSWLLNSIRGADYYFPSSCQLRDEFDRNYRVANCAPLKKFLAELDDFEKLGELYKLRWEAIGHADWQSVIEDVESLKLRSLQFDNFSSSWVDLLADSMEYTVWQTDPKCTAYNRECWREISESRRTWTADSVELLLLAAEEWQRMQDLFPWYSALPWARNTFPGTLRQIWLPVANSIALDRNRSLKILNQFFRSHPIAMSFFGEGLSNLANLNQAVESDQSWDETRDLAACFFADGPRREYAAFRQKLLDFCVLNHVEPISFAHAANSFLDSDSPVGWTELVKKDGPLLCVYNAGKAVSF